MRLRGCFEKMVAGLCLSAPLACGGSLEDGDLAGHVGVAFEMQALTCDLEGLEAELEADKIEGVCPLRITSARTVEGVCRVPTGEVITFKLVYGYDRPCGEGRTCRATAAEVKATLNLTHARRREVVLEFKSEDLRTDFDDDLDGRSNIQEFCEGTNPFEPDP